ncbi:MAG TPA: hypothetical protein VFA94_10545 [Acidimicrobiales bacterium]|nr:hypothetical protein [Acidimicrobiales bacterium]
MTELLDTTGIRQALARPRLRREEVDALRALTVHLPVLLPGGHTPSRPVSVDEALVRLDAAVWQAAASHGIDICCDSTILEVADRLTAAGWTSPSASAAVRAMVMLRYAAGRTPATVADEVDMLDAAARLTAYLELRTRFG